MVRLSTPQSPLTAIVCFSAAGPACTVMLSPRSNLQHERAWAFDRAARWLLSPPALPGQQDRVCLGQRADTDTSAGFLSELLLALATRSVPCEQNCLRTGLQSPAKGRALLVQEVSTRTLPTSFFWFLEAAPGEPRLGQGEIVV